MDKLKIGYVLQPFDNVVPPHKGSLSLWAFEVSKRMSAGNDVTVFQRGFYKLIKNSRLGSVALRLIPIIWDVYLSRLLFMPLYHIIYKGRVPYYYTTFFYFIYIVLISLYSRKQKLDIIHILNYANFAPIVKKMNPGSKVVLNMRCQWLSQMDPGIVKKYLRYVDCIVGCSDYITNLIKKKYPELSDKCTTVYNGVDKTAFGFSSEKHADELLYVGRISPEKGVHTLIHSLPLVLEKYPDLKLTLIGPRAQLPFDKYLRFEDDEIAGKLVRFYPKKGSDSYYQQYLDDYVNANHLGDHVTFLGTLSHDELPPYYQMACIFIYPSVCGEAFGIPPVEAMATGTPVIVTRSGGIVETVVDNVTGFLVNREDSRDLAEKISFLLSHHDIVIKYGRNARSRIEKKFTWNKITGDFLGLYHGLCAGTVIGSLASMMT